jgi:translocation and assembly module TamA
MKLLSGCRSLFLITCSALGFGASFAQVPALEINTANAQLTDNIRAHVRLPSISCASDDVELARALRSRVATLTNTVERASQAVGFYSAEPQLTLEKTADCWLLSIAVEAGDPVLIKSVAISIEVDADLFANTLENLPLREGSQLSHGDYEAAKAELTARAFELGYLDARFTLARLTIDKPQLAASIELALDLGARHRFGQIAFDTGGALSNDFVNRFVTFNEGDFYSPQKLLDLRSALNDSQYFADISITPRLGETSNLVPIDLVMTSRPRRVYEYGAGITTDTGPRLSGYYEDRFRNPEGHRVNATTSLSPIQRSLDADYLIPLANPTMENLRVSAGWIEENTDTFDSRSYRTSVAYTFVNRSNWRQSYFTNYRHDEFDVNGVRETSDLLIPGVSITKTQADSALVPNKGWQLFAQVRGASSDLLASETFVQFNLNGKWITPLGRGRFISRFELVATVADSIAELPVSIQTFTGGDQSIRGYDYKSIGARNSEGLITGGKSLAVASAEVDFGIAEKWRLALFTDVGDAFDDFNQVNFKQSAGVGIRWISPIGPIRIDLARPINSGEGVRLHLSMGPDL